MTDKKMGRPTDNPKPHKVTIRMDDQTLKTLDAYCEKENVERSEGVRQAINRLNGQ